MFVRKAGPEKVAAGAEEGGIRKLVSREVAEPPRQLPKPRNGEIAARDASLHLQRVIMASMQEIDGLISDLKALRERLQHESDRTAHGSVDHASLGQAVNQSSRIIAEYLRYLEKRFARAKHQRMIASRRGGHTTPDSATG